MAERLVQVTIVEAVPIPAAERVDCGMTPDDCGSYTFEGGADHICNRRIASDEAELAKTRSSLHSLQQQLGGGSEPIEPMVRCGMRHQPM